MIWVLVVIGLLVLAGVIQLPMLKELLPGSVTQTTSTGISLQCPDDKQLDLQVRMRNKFNQSAEWISGNVHLIDAKTGKSLTTITLNTDGTFKTIANALSCGGEYYVAVVNDPNIIYVRSPTKVAGIVDPSNGQYADKVQFDIEGGKSSDLKFNLYSSNFGNETNTGNPFSVGSQDFTTVSNFAMGQGDSIQLRYEVRTSASASGFGSSERIVETDTGVAGRAFVCITGASNVYAKEDIVISGSAILGRTPILPKLCAVSTPANAGVGLIAYEVKQITSDDGTLSGTIDIRASLGNPSDTNNVRFIWMDNGAYIGSTGAVKIGTADDSLTDTMETNRYFEVNIQ